MLPWIREYNYIRDYFYTAYKLYIDLYKGYPVTYYSIDRDNTVWENEYAMGGSYDKLGVGSLSGVVWKKIYLLPLYGIDEINPSQDSSESAGISYFQSMTLNVSFPSKYGLKPLEGDVIDMNFAFENPTINIKPIFVVSSINLAHHGEYNNVYQCILSVAPFNANDIDKQISTYWMFVEHEKKIYPYDDATFLLNNVKKSKSLSNYARDSFNEKTSLFFREVE